MLIWQHKTFKPKNGWDLKLGGHTQTSETPTQGEPNPQTAGDQHYSLKNQMGSNMMYRFLSFKVYPRNNAEFYIDSHYFQQVWKSTCATV